MGQKVHPHGFRLGVIKRHSSIWYAEGQTYRQQLLADMRARRYLEKKLVHAQVSSIIIERLATSNVTVRILTARPGAVIGKKGEEINQLKSELGSERLLGVESLSVEIEEVKKPDLDAALIARTLARQLEGRVMFRRAIRKAIQNAVRQGVKGIRVQVSGRLGGADIARTEWAKEGRVPLHTLRADIDYASVRAQTTYGVIGVKVWVFKGDVIDSDNTREAEES